MTRKEIEKDSDRPHYYSQFWLDVAAGRRVIGQPRPEEGEILEPEPEPMLAPRRSLRATQAEVSDGRIENIVHPVAEPIAAPDAFIEPEGEEFEEEDELNFPIPVEDADIPDMDLGVEEEDEEEEEGFEGEEEEEEDEDDIGWGGGRARKKAKPTRPVKPVAKKPPRREPRRGY
jgi:hypothetical protein